MKYQKMFFLSLFVIVAWFMTGPRADIVYPLVADSPYLLPWNDSVSRACMQGNRGLFVHRGFGEFAWDFLMPIGSHVIAARGGQVIEAIDDFQNPGFSDGNRIVITHADGSRATYSHLKFAGSLVKVGQTVWQGQQIGYSGMTGALYPHLHFHVTSPNGVETIPITFKDVPGGIPLAGRIYTSRNMPGNH